MHFGFFFSIFYDDRLPVVFGVDVEDKIHHSLARDLFNDYIIFQKELWRMKRELCNMIEVLGLSNQEAVLIYTVMNLTLDLTLIC